MKECKRHKAQVTDMTAFLFCHSYLAFLVEVCLLNARLEHSRSNLFSEIRNILFSECSICHDFLVRRVGQIILALAAVPGVAAVERWIIAIEKNNI